MAITENGITLCGHGSGNPSTKNMNSYLSSRYASKASNGKRKGVVCVLRLKALTDAKRKEFANTYATILGRNKYNQSLRSYVYTKYNGSYYSDCSSSICATFKKIGYNVSLLNTAGMYYSSLFEKVNVNIVNGHITNPEVLKVGDCLMFAGSDPSRPLQIGHVEAVYKINGSSSSVTTTTSTTSNSGSNSSNVEKGQDWLNDNYEKVIKDTTGKLLVVDGDYGTHSRWGALIVWKDVMNRKHGASLTLSNKNFGNTCKSFANNALVKNGSSGTFTYICQFILSAKGFYNGKMNGKCGSDTVSGIKSFQRSVGISDDGECGANTWYKLFN